MCKRFLWIVVIVILATCAAGATPPARADTQLPPPPPLYEMYGSFVLCGKTYVNLSQVAVYQPSWNGGCELVGPAGTTILTLRDGECGCIAAAIHSLGK